MLDWSPTLMVGHHGIDEQHQKLGAIANRLNEALQDGHGREVCGPILNEPADYTVKHLAFEEDPMRRMRYPQAEAHLAEHKKLISRIGEFQRRF